MDYPKEVDIRAYSATTRIGVGARTVLAEDSLEYRQVERLLREDLSGVGFTVNRIEVLNNPATFAAFAANVELFKGKTGAKVMRLLHGTPLRNVDDIVQSNLQLSKINLNDFNRRTNMYCGDGIYFTDKTAYARTYARLDPPSGCHYMFLCDVLVGNMCRSGARLPPVGFDTTRPVDTNIDGYAKFADGEFYPTHLIVLQPFGTIPAWVYDEAGRQALPSDYPKEIDVLAYSATVSIGKGARTVLAEDSLEYGKVQRLFREHLGGERLTLNRIEVLNNPATFAAFAANVELYKGKPGAKVMRLLHGTAFWNVDAVVQSNQLPSRRELVEPSCAPGGFCGHGVSFTDRAAYASRFARREPATGCRYLFLFDVLVGNVCLSRTSCPPPGYDTTRPIHDFTDGYAKFGDAEFYPTHLIVLKDEMAKPAASSAVEDEE
ncbi:uncharacterized protein LOC117649711 [Thrips palmi]|uniref:Uncharacterized protein LOC117649711 n=1 Tax=Thrips palmi TaxID=161013 RepID=A0A6P8ZTG9_THRPL|nr:uncharacterized protein LOC117649711 [Thrips palmi]